MAAKYLSGTQTAALSDIAVGTRVVVTTSVEGEKMIATEVKIVSTISEKGSAPKASPH